VPDAEQELQSVRKELEALRFEHRRLQSSGSYRIAHLLVETWSSPRLWLSFPLRLLSLLFALRRSKRLMDSDTTILAQLRNEWEKLCEQAVSHNTPLVFLFSGTTYIQGIRGNRPIRQAQALLRSSSSILFSYYRLRRDEPLPDYQSNRLVQMPQDITLQMLPEIASANLGSAPRLFVVSYPWPGIEKQIELFHRYGWRVIYDCRDDWQAFARAGMARWFRTGIERKLVKQCDATFCVSKPLLVKMQRLAPKEAVYLVPNAVDADFVPADYQRKPAEPLTVGYFGHLSSAWFDWSSLIRIADTCPNINFEIIGHGAPPDLILPSNVFLIGAQPWENLYRFASSWSAAIIPFRMGKLADGVDPIKIYEYLSLGLPTVSFRMPQIEDYPYTWTVDSVDAFCKALRHACGVTVEPSVIEDFIKNNTWEKRAEQLLMMARNKC